MSKRNLGYIEANAVDHHRTKPIATFKDLATFIMDGIMAINL